MERIDVEIKGMRADQETWLRLTPNEFAALRHIALTVDVPPPGSDARPLVMLSVDDYDRLVAGGTGIEALEREPEEPGDSRDVDC